LFDKQCITRSDADYLPVTIIVANPEILSIVLIKSLEIYS